MVSTTLRVFQRTLQRVFIWTPDFTSPDGVAHFDVALLFTFLSLHFAPFVFLSIEERPNKPREVQCRLQPLLMNEHNARMDTHCTRDRNHPWVLCPTCCWASYCSTCTPNTHLPCRLTQKLVPLLKMIPYLACVDSDRATQVNTSLMNSLERLQTAARSLHTLYGKQT